MNLFCALLLVASEADELPREMALEDSGLSDGWFARVQGGVWGSRRFRFSATQASGNAVSTSGEALGSVGVELGGRFSQHWVLFGSIEGDFRTDIRAELGSLSLGYRDAPGYGAPAGVPDELMIYLGPIGGHFEVTTPGFGSFRNGLGGRVGVDLLWKLSEGTRFTLAAEWRYISFDYSPSITEGDNRIGGGTYWVGAGLEFRF